VAVQLVVVLQATIEAFVAPNATEVAPAAVLKPVPVIVTLVPPAVEPEVGLIPVTVGATAAPV
jgi:hypothetical protein